VLELGLSETITKLRVYKTNYKPHGYRCGGVSLKTSADREFSAGPMRGDPSDLSVGKLAESLPRGQRY